jgi:anti-sigma-K factor RskA
MSLLPTSGDPADLAAEHALGLLDGDERRAAQDRLARDPQFRSDVAHWRGMLAPLLDEVAPVEPPARLWTAVERRIADSDVDDVGNDSERPNNVVQLRRRVAVWRGFAAGATALAASLALVLVTRPTSVAPPPPAAQAPAPAPLVAMLGDDERGGLMVAKWEPATRRMTIAAPQTISLEPGRMQELWIIQANGTPRSLGVLPSNDRNELLIVPAVAQQLQAGATLAVSVEPSGGSPTGLPTGPVIATGKLGLV